MLGPPRARRVLVRCIDVTVVVAFVVGAFFFWPARFGGTTTAVVVGGHSMEPTYQVGDIVLVRAGTPTEGDIVAFDPPIESSGRPLVIHRIVGGDPSGWITQGDNNPSPDPWKPPSEDVVGVAVLRIPYAGRLLSVLVNPIFFAVILGLGTVVLLWPRARQGEGEEADDEGGEADAEGQVRASGL